MNRKDSPLTRMRKVLSHSLLSPQAFVYSAFAGALVGGAIGRAIDALVAVQSNTWEATALMLLGALVVSLSGVFLLRIAARANLIDRLIANYVEVQGKEGHEVAVVELERYEREKEEEYGARVLGESACFLASLLVGVFLIVLGHTLDC